jgi:cytochrome c-type biogenesis protein CcmH
MWRVTRVALALCSLTAPVHGARAEAESSFDEARARARALALEKQLMAPCCWQQTLDIHHSELADTLHVEIHDRLARGEPASAVRDSLVRRYGARILAVPDARWLEGAATAVILLLAAAGAWLWRRGLTWSRRSQGDELTREPHVEESESARAQNYDSTLDEELRRME